MQITYLGHAGFCVETLNSLVIMDPWLSPTGAFDSAWFQFPRNHHLAAFIQEKLQSTNKECFLYISHEHKDHFDPAFLNSLESRNFTLIVPKFQRTKLIRYLSDYRCKGMIQCLDNQRIPIPGGSVTVYLDDSEMDRDSAILVQADGQAFFNINDCKIHDRLSEIKQMVGAIDVFTAQFSGAVWHPTCYDYPRKTYEAISSRKMISKFETVARAIDTLKPKTYLTSAGPACFLDPALIHLNFERMNIFPHAQKFIDYVQKRLKRSKTSCHEPMPGDVFDVNQMKFVSLAKERVTEKNFEKYIMHYADMYEVYFKDRQYQYAKEELDELYERLREVLMEKLTLLTLRDRVKIPLYFRLSDQPERMLRVDFVRAEIEYATDIPEGNYYSITAPSWEIARVLNHRLTWEDFTLTFRMRLNRDPDIYHVVIHGFLMMEAEDMNRFCAQVLRAETNQTRALFEVGGRRYSIHRYCPHQGADLTQAWVQDGRFLTCPRHRWQFDLDNEGKCTTNNTSICAFPIEDE